MKPASFTGKSLLTAGVLLVLPAGCGGDDGPRGAASYDIDALGVHKFLTDVIITKAERDAAPLTCASEAPGSDFIGPPDTLAMDISF